MSVSCGTKRKDTQAQVGQDPATPGYRDRRGHSELFQDHAACIRDQQDLAESFFRMRLAIVKSPMT
jgi:hypothetical protein